ncbi:MAG: c-type cytochrome [Hydrogenophaga sp.]|jgi:cytochrome c553|uniref:c-type cytochrome n=1 Tax=Hydrogenophaga sp. TaxID=1904254 RepID=UPI002A372188|nr:c-type cytochrome [Hydrogenophaga sp.]MDX9969634.1 c-type cytochrome [Hydrogenophaga sp.]
MNNLSPTIVRTVVAAATLLAASAAVHAEGSVEAGKQKAEMCIGCHGIPGYQNSFPEVHKVPKISGQSDKFIVSALTAYKKGDRKHPTMRGIAGSLSEQDMADLAAFYASHTDKTAAETASAPSDVVKALLEKGACASCHGANFSKPIDPSYPKLGGQHADYLFVAMKAYTVEGNAMVGRSNGIMGAVAKQFNPNEMRALAQYLSAQETELKTVPQSRFK